jgi:hypothetical protein
MHQHITPSDHGPAAPDLTAAVFKLDVLLLEPTRSKARSLTLMESRLSSRQRRMPAARAGILVGRGAAGWP